MMDFALPRTIRFWFVVFPAMLVLACAYAFKDFLTAKGRKLLSAGKVAR